jgi:hypothetical protein
LPRKIFSHTVPVLAAMSFSALVALRIAGGLAGDMVETATPVAAKLAAQGATAKAPAAKGAIALRSAAAIAPALKSASAEPGVNPYGALFAPEGALVGAPQLFADSKPVGPAFSPLQSEPLFVPDEPGDEIAEAAPAQPTQSAPSQQLALAVAPERPALIEEDEPGAPIPPARPAEFSAAKLNENASPRDPAPRRDAQRAPLRPNAQTTTFAKNDPRSFFDKLFGESEEKGQQLAYASPEGGALKMSRGVTSAARPVDAEGGTAVYDISSHTVYLPGGERLEAHSGLGAYFDDPDHVHLRMRGATPPATYKLTLRESLFHGVQALRLTPLDSDVHGRSGLLAHTFMLGQRGDSNGCVSFRNYRAFLEAYMRGEVRKLKVVASR